jgi:N-acyl-D-aspartate/D-glutamate deacylase
MCREVASAFEHGAIGFTSSRNAAHLTTDGAPVASRLAEWSEIEALVGTAGAYPGAMYEFATEPDARAEDPAVKRRYLARLLELAVRSQARLTFGIVPVLGRDEDEWRDLLALLDEADSYGARMVGQAHCRGMTIYNSFLTQLPFDRLPLWRELRAMSPERKLAALNDPALRARLIAEADTGSFAEGVGAEARPPDYEKLVVLQSPLPPNPSVAELARARGVSPVEVIIDLARADELRTFFVQYVGDTSAKTLGSIIRHPSTVMTFSDAGAHVGQIVDGGLQVFFLAHWVRVLQEFTLEEAVRMVTWEPARAWGLAGRGLIRPGFAADLNILDPESIGPRAPEIVADLPGGNIRLEQRAQGLHFTVVNGVVTMAAGESTGRDPGHLLRRRSTGSGRSA